MEKGVIKYYNYKRLFGFIKSPKSDIEIFFHKHECRYEDIQEGDKVTYVLHNSHNKPGSLLAVEVKKLENNEKY